MRLLLTLAAVILCTLAGWKYYPELYKAISGKEAPVGELEKSAAVNSVTEETAAPVKIQEN